jgi:hypothetical protein
MTSLGNLAMQKRESFSLKRSSAFEMDNSSNSFQSDLLSFIDMSIPTTYSSRGRKRT